MVLGNKVLRRIFGSKKGEITRGRRKLHNEEFDLCLQFSKSSSSSPLGSTAQLRPWPPP
jgi:hypothetical protein